MDVFNVGRKMKHVDAARRQVNLANRKSGNCQTLVILFSSQRKFLTLFVHPKITFDWHLQHDELRVKSHNVLQ